MQWNGGINSSNRRKKGGMGPTQLMQKGGFKGRTGAHAPCARSKLKEVLSSTRIRGGGRGHDGEGKNLGSIEEKKPDKEREEIKGGL